MQRPPRGEPAAQRPRAPHLRRQRAIQVPTDWDASAVATTLALLLRETASTPRSGPARRLGAALGVAAPPGATPGGGAAVAAASVEAAVSGWQADLSKFEKAQIAAEALVADLAPLLPAADGEPQPPLADAVRRCLDMAAKALVRSLRASGTLATPVTLTAVRTVGALVAASDMAWHALAAAGAVDALAEASAHLPPTSLTVVTLLRAVLDGAECPQFLAEVVPAPGSHRGPIVALLASLATTALAHVFMPLWEALLEVVQLHRSLALLHARATATVAAGAWTSGADAVIVTQALAAAAAIKSLVHASHGPWPFDPTEDQGDAERDASVPDGDGSIPRHRRVLALAALDHRALTRAVVRQLRAHRTAWSLATLLTASPHGSAPAMAVIDLAATLCERPETATALALAPHDGKMPCRRDRAGAHER